jgi:hypothetical protein
MAQLLTSIARPFRRVQQEIAQQFPLDSGSAKRTALLDMLA